MPATKHREKILEVLQEWFRIHQQGPTLEELCMELGKPPRQKATVQKWLQTMRGIDVEWEDHVPRTLHLLNPEPEEPALQISSAETLRYLATGLVEWGQRDRLKRDRLPLGLRIGMSRMYLASQVQGEKAPANLPEFFAWATEPVISWPSAREIKNLSPDVTLIDDGCVSDLAFEWQVTGNNVQMQVEESVVLDVLQYCRGHQMEESYRSYRKLIIEKPTLPYKEYRRWLSSPQLRPLREFLSRTYINLTDLAENNTYHLCPRCHYVQRRRHDGSYRCRNSWCDRLCAKLNLSSVETISQTEAKEWKVVKPGIHRDTTLPGIWEIQLAQELSKLGVKVTLWPKIDAFDLLVEFSRKRRWAIDVKDWSSLHREMLEKVAYQPDVQETFVVFPDEREEALRIQAIRQDIEPELGGVKLRLMSEIIKEARAIVEKKKNA